MNSSVVAPSLSFDVWLKCTFGASAVTVVMCELGGAPVAQSLGNYWAKSSISDSFLLAVLPVLKSHGMDFNNGDSALLPLAAQQCSVQVVAKLLDLGADPASTMYTFNASGWAAMTCQDNERQQIDNLIEAKLRTLGMQAVN